MIRRSLCKMPCPLLLLLPRLMSGLMMGSPQSSKSRLLRLRAPLLLGPLMRHTRSKKSSRSVIPRMKSCSPTKEAVTLLFRAKAPLRRRKAVRRGGRMAR